MLPLAFRPDDPAVLADPFPLYQRLRDEDPVHWSPQLRAWVLNLRSRTHHNKVAVALANKMARIAWAVCVRERDYCSRPVAA